MSKEVSWKARISIRTNPRVISERWPWGRPAFLLLFCGRACSCVWLVPRHCVRLRVYLSVNKVQLRQIEPHFLTDCFLSPPPVLHPVCSRAKPRTPPQEQADQHTLLRVCDAALFPGSAGRPPKTSGTHLQPGLIRQRLHGQTQSWLLEKLEL